MLQFESVIAVFVIKQYSVLFNHKELVELCEKITIDHFFELYQYWNIINIIASALYVFYKFNINKLNFWIKFY